MKRAASGRAFGRNLIVLGLAVFAVGGWAALEGWRTLRWPRASARVVDAGLLRQQVQSTLATRSGWRDEWNSFHVLYVYRVAGREYVSGRVEPYDFGMQNSAGAAGMSERHPIGSTAEVAYLPADPSIAYIEPGPSSFSRVLAVIGGLVGLGGWWVQWMASRGVGRMTRR